MKTTTTKKMYSFIIMMMFSLLCAYAQSSMVDYNHVQVINPVIGDISFVEKFGYQPDAATNEDLRIQTHLSYAENLLRQKDASSLSEGMQQKRNHMLDLLHDYWTRGKFPRNYDYKETRKPCFIDKNGTICAVGYLVEQSAGREVAEAINNKYKYGFVMEMNDALVDNWIAQSGLTKEECATIQPDYGGGWGCYCSCTNHPKYNQLCYTKPNGTQGCRNAGCKTGKENVIAYETSLDYISPNPVFTSSTISFYVAKDENVLIKVFDINGRLVASIGEGFYKEGDHDVFWDASGINSGIYFLRMEAGDYVQTEKISVIK